MKAGCVNEREFFALCQRMERFGIRTGWPHPSQLYRQLCGKLWIPQMCLNRDYRVPPTTRVHFQEFFADPNGVADRAIRCLGVLWQKLWSGDDALLGASLLPPEKFRGVAKLGFSWMGKDVWPFEGSESLVKALRTLFAQEDSQQLVCHVQLMVPAVLVEIRALVFWDACTSAHRWEKVYMKLWDKKPEAEVSHFATTSATVVHLADAARELFEGDTMAQEHVEREVDMLVERWLLWFSTECVEPPILTRLDFLVSQPLPGQLPSVWSCEVTECGSSLCGLEVDARNAVALNFALRHDRTGRFPKPLPAFKFRPDPFKPAGRALEV